MTGWENIYLFVRHARVSNILPSRPERKYCTFLARLNDLAKSYLTIRPLFFFLFFSILFFLCAFPGLFGACATAYRDFFFYCQVFYKGAHMSCDNTDCYKLFGHRATFF